MKKMIKRIGATLAALLLGGQVAFAYTINGNLIVSGSIQNPSITGIVSGGASYTGPTITNPSITGTVSGSATYSTVTLTVPTIASFASATHTHQNAAGGGTLDCAAVASSVTGSGNCVKATSPSISNPTISGTVAGGATYNTITLFNPTIGSFVNAVHDHLTNAGGGNLSGNAITTNITGTGNVVKNNGPTLAGTVTVGSGAASAISPSLSNTFDIGGSGAMFHDIYAAGFIGQSSGSARVNLGNGGRIEILGGNFSIPATDKLFLDGGSNTSIRESSADVITFEEGGSDQWTFDGNGIYPTSNNLDDLGKFGNSFQNIYLADVIYYEASSQSAAVAEAGVVGTTYSIFMNGTTRYNFGQNEMFPGVSGVNLGKTAAANRWDTIFLANVPDVSSDKRLKKEIRSSDLGLDFIKRLNPVSYRWKKGDELKHYGFIAQDVEKVLDGKEFAGVKKPVKNDGEFYSMGYDELISPIVKAIQELNAQVDELKKEKGRACEARP